MSAFEDEAQTVIQRAAGLDGDGPQSLMEALRAKREEIASTRETSIPISGYSDMGLAAVHRLMDRDEVSKIGKRIVSEFKTRDDRNMFLLVDTIINSTTGFTIQREHDKNPIPLTTPDGEIVYYWNQLAEGLGWEPNGDARSALYYVFGDNDFAVGQHAIMLNRWFGDTSIKIDQEFLGEGV